MAWGAVMRPVPLLATKKRQNSEHLFRLSPLESTFGASLRFFCLFLPIFAHLFLLYLFRSH